MLKDLLYTGNIEKVYKLETKNNKGNSNGIILINNYPKCKSVECPNEKKKTG